MHMHSPEKRKEDKLKIKENPLYIVLSETHRRATVPLHSSVKVLSDSFNVEVIEFQNLRAEKDNNKAEATEIPVRNKWFARSRIIHGRKSNFEFAREKK